MLEVKNNLEKVEVECAALDILMDMMIEVETDPRLKSQMLVMKQCKKLSNKFADISKKYVVHCDEQVTETELNGLLEFLRGVEKDTDDYIGELKGV